MNILLQTKYLILTAIILLGSFFIIWKLDQVPVSLFGDELDIGYHALSLLKTGKDYMGNIPVFYVHSLADKKSPLYSFTAVPFVGQFGISPLGIRLPAAIFGILGILLIYLISEWLTNYKIALITTLVAAFSPWYLHYSRWGFEGTLMLSLFLLAIYSFLRGLTNNRWLVLSALSFSLTPYAYHAAKILLPITISILVFVWWNQIKRLSVSYITVFIIIVLLITGPIFFNSFYGQGSERFSGVSVFNYPKYIEEINTQRGEDLKQQFSLGRLFHNKFTFWGDRISDNYLQAFSLEFLFLKGDSNLRHSIPQYGQFYKFQAIFLLLGLIFLLTKPLDRQVKFFILLWMIQAPLPSIITVDGGNHASRLLFMLPVISLLIALGIYHGYLVLKRKFKIPYIVLVSALFVISFIWYQHNYFFHYTYDSEKWWHSGFKQAVTFAVSESEKYDKVIISNADEPSLIFFLAWSSFPVDKFRKQFPLSKEHLGNFGIVSKLDKFYFTEQGFSPNLYELDSLIPANSLYLATAKEINLNLIEEPNRVPPDIKLIKSIAYPSGLPAFYFFTKNI